MSKKKDTEPFIPLEDEQGNAVDSNEVNPDEWNFEGSAVDPVIDPEKNLDAEQDAVAESQGETPESNFKLYKSIYSGVTPIPVVIDNVKRYLKFDKHTYRTDNVEEQEALEAIMEADKDLLPKNRRVLSVDDFLELTSPDKVFVDVDGESLHISEIREAVGIAKKHGWKPTGKKVIILNTRSKINQGSSKAFSGGI
jgi:hypothetical protein